MEWFRAADTFTADLADGTVVRVVKGDPYPGSHELVQRDKDAAAAAEEAGIDRVLLFRQLDTGEEEAPAPPPPSPKRSSRAAAVKAKAS